MANGFVKRLIALFNLRPASQLERRMTHSEVYDNATADKLKGKECEWHRSHSHHGWENKGIGEDGDILKGTPCRNALEAQGKSGLRRRIFRRGLGKCGVPKVESEGCPDAGCVCSSRVHPKGQVTSDDHDEEGDDEDGLSNTPSFAGLSDDVIVSILQRVPDMPTLVRCSALSRRFRRLVIEVLQEVQEVALSNPSLDQVRNVLTMARDVREITLELVIDGEGKESQGSVLPMVPSMLGAQNEPMFLRVLGKGGMADAPADTQRPMLERWRLRFRGPATWEFYRMVVLSSMEYARRVVKSEAILISFSLRIGVEHLAAPSTSPNWLEGNNDAPSSSSCRSWSMWQSGHQRVDWFGSVFLATDDVTSPSGYRAACRNLKLLMSPRLFALRSLPHSSVRKRGCLPPVMFEIEFSHGVSQSKVRRTNNPCKLILLESDLSIHVSSSNIGHSNSSEDRNNISSCVARMLEQCLDDMSSS
ncbi:hypothetical protein CBR_g64837 [Chara braunii]|uniref:Uncharacterized protein n=1 Tax=Chara braunii TaxID=69332 RepID=A0A388K964_CHABU|nr:hypothetical protein CBR_g64837 [Chara braunii]|eukprot:GBG66566.1 hypothetical protein CBR_g64837 [Chara braunii]